MKDIFCVTGAGGKVGSRVVSQLAERGDTVRVAARATSNLTGLQDSFTERVEFDLARPETYERAFSGATKLFFVSPTVVHPTDHDRASAVCAAAARAGVRHIVMLSGLSDAPGDETIFGAAMKEMEKRVESSGISWTFLRPNSFFQNLLEYDLPTIQSDNAIYSSVGDGRVSMIDTRDIARIAVLALTGDGHEGKAYELTGPEAVSLAEVAAEISRVAGRTIMYVPVEDETVRQHMLGTGLPAYEVEAVVDLYRSYRNGNAATVSPAYAELTGRKPASVRDFVDDFAASFRL